MSMTLLPKVAEGAAAAYVELSTRLAWQNCLGLAEPRNAEAHGTFDSPMECHQVIPGHSFLKVMVTQIIAHPMNVIKRHNSF